MKSQIVYALCYPNGDTIKEYSTIEEARRAWNEFDMVGCYLQVKMA